MRLKMSIRSKIIIATMMLVFISLFVSGCFFFFNYYKLLVNNTYDSLDISIAQLQESVDKNIIKLESMTSTVVRNRQINAWLNNDIDFAGNTNDIYIKLNQLMTELQSALIFDNSWLEEYIQSIHIFIDDQHVQILTRNVMQRSDEKAKFEQIKTYADQINKTTIFVPPQNNKSNVYFIKKVTNYYDNRTLFIICEINQSFLSKELQRFSNQFFAYIADQEGKIYFSNNQDALGGEASLDLPSIKKITQFNDLIGLFNPNLTELTVSKPLERKEFRIVYSIQRADLFSQIVDSMRDFVLISVVILIIFVALTVIILSTYTRVIPDVVNRLNEISNQNYKAKMPRYNDWQLDLISQTFNRMTTEIETLINKVYRNELLLKENEFKLLQSQMNPHFLTNTMTTISTGAYIRGEQKTYDSISALNKFISGRLKSMTEPNFVTVESELKYIELYLYLQSLRFTDRLNYSIKILEPDLLTMMIPRLMIEPIVENAVIHGIEDQIETGKVDIVIKREGQNLVVEVIDNGKGFNINEFSLEPKASDQERLHIGMYNTNKRLQLIYGPEYGLNVVSQIGIGTHVTLRIPITDKNEFDVGVGGSA
jgi:two-component system sensor histidine kinase YesM